MKDKPTMEERLEAWAEEVAETYDEENADVQKQIKALGGPDEETQLAAIQWANAENRDSLLFMLAICVSEVVRRWGIEATNNVLSGLLDKPAVAALGEVVNAGYVMDTGGTPERFEAEDLEAALRIRMAEDDGGPIIIDMNTGEIT